MGSYVPIPMPMPMMMSGGGGCLPLEAAWALGGTMIFLSLLLSVALGWMAKVIWEDDIKIWSVILGLLTVFSLLAIPFLVINFIIIPAYGA